MTDASEGTDSTLRAVAPGLDDLSDEQLAPNRRGDACMQHLAPIRYRGSWEGLSDFLQAQQPGNTAEDQLDTDKGATPGPALTATHPASG